MESEREVHRRVVEKQEPVTLRAGVADNSSANFCESSSVSAGKETAKAAKTDANDNVEFF